MIVSVRGVLDAVGPDWVHLQVGGVTLQAFVPEASIGDLGPIGGQVSLYTHLRFRDDQPMLYGFTTPASLELFLLLNGVSGVGPRLALALLSKLGASSLNQAILSGDIVSLASASGVGRRTASRIVLDLKGKVEADDAGILADQSSDDDAQNGEQAHVRAQDLNVGVHWGRENKETLNEELLSLQALLGVRPLSQKPFQIGFIVWNDCPMLICHPLLKLAGGEERNDKVAPSEKFSNGFIVLRITKIKCIIFSET